jgi:hypothetical protein
LALGLGASPCAAQYHHGCRSFWSDATVGDLHVVWG